MTTIFTRNKNTIQYIPDSAVPAGTVVPIGNLTGVAKTDLAAHEYGILY